MNAANHAVSTSAADHSLQTAFMRLLPRIQTHAQIYFRNEKCAGKKADQIAETVALAWKWFVRLHERGKDVQQFPMVFIFFVARAVKNGRRLCGMERWNEVLSTVAQRRYGFAVESLPNSPRSSHAQRHSSVHGQHQQDVYEERLQDNTQTPVPEQAAFRIDFPAWLRTLTGRERRLIREMARNERTKDLSRKFEVSAARISQMRREFEDGWKRYCSDTDPERRIGDRCVGCV